MTFALSLLAVAITRDPIVYDAEYTTAGTFTYTPTVSGLYEVLLIGGGGGGRGSYGGYSGGGGSGRALKANLSLVAGTAYTLTVGAGSTGTAAGGNTTFVGRLAGATSDYSGLAYGGQAGGAGSAGNGGSGGGPGNSAKDGYGGSNGSNGTGGQYAVGTGEGANYYSSLDANVTPGTGGVPDGNGGGGGGGWDNNVAPISTGQGRGWGAGAGGIAALGRNGYARIRRIS